MVLPFKHAYSKRIASFLLFGNSNALNDYEVISVKTWKQWQKIDLCAEFVLKNKTTQQEEKYALLIEDKMYGRNTQEQLQRYKAIFEEDYQGKGFELKYVCFTCHDNVLPEEKQICEELGFSIYTMDEVLLQALGNDWQLTENALFDEFWLSTW